MTTETIGAIAQAFTDTAERYDTFANDHPHLTRMRSRVYAAVERWVPQGSHILELNAGTGTDAVALAHRGYRVHATDIAPGMLARAADKVAALGLHGRVSVQACSFLDLAAVDGGPYDAVFSNLGGLNCTDDLATVARGIDPLLRGGGVAVLVVMPPVCLWELGLIVTGRVRLATRRLRRGGTIAHLEGRHFPVHYFSARAVVAAFGDGYERVHLEALSVITPTAESKGLARRHPRVYRGLAWLDDRLSPRRPFSRWGDFVILVIRKRAAVDAA